MFLLAVPCSGCFFVLIKSVWCSPHISAVLYICRNFSCTWNGLGFLNQHYPDHLPWLMQTPCNLILTRQNRLSLSRMLFSFLTPVTPCESVSQRRDCSALQWEAETSSNASRWALEHPAAPETGDTESVHQETSAPPSGLGTILIEDKCLKCGPLTKDLFILMQNGMEGT